MPFIGGQPPGPLNHSSNDRHTKRLRCPSFRQLPMRQLSRSVASKSRSRLLRKTVGPVFGSELSLGFFAGRLPWGSAFNLCIWCFQRDTQQTLFPSFSWWPCHAPFSQLGSGPSSCRSFGRLDFLSCWCSHEVTHIDQCSAFTTTRIRAEKLSPHPARYALKHQFLLIIQGIAS